MLIYTKQQHISLHMHLCASGKYTNEKNSKIRITVIRGWYIFNLLDFTILAYREIIPICSPFNTGVAFLYPCQIYLCVIQLFNLNQSERKNAIILLFLFTFLIERYFEHLMFVSHYWFIVNLVLILVYWSLSYWFMRLFYFKEICPFCQI